ncbi:MAG: quinol:cytochrome C oxidoreductase, partial [Bacteroidetes bacterium]|nr:quinol:cytochrome C oxidoreductase [Bacteroidota bacterium]
MFTIDKKAKNFSMALMAIGIMAVIFGFISITKAEKQEVFRIAKTKVLLLMPQALKDIDDKALKELQITKREDIESIFHEVEKELDIEFTSSEIEKSFCINDIVKASNKYINQKFFSRFWPSLLFNIYFYLGISVFAVFFVALQYVAEAGWSIVLKRVPEAIMGALPVFSGIMLFIMIASIMHWNHIYHWLHEGIMDPASEHYDRIIAGKEPYLNATFFVIRTIVYLLGWNYFAKKLRSLSLLEDKQSGSGIHFKGISTSAWFMVFFAVTSAMASWDWIMSIDAHWFSTIFGWYVFAEWSAIGFTTIFLFTLYLKRQGYLKDVNESHIHDLGKWIFAFSLVWTYMWFSQFMLI